MKKGGDFSRGMTRDIFGEHEQFMKIMKNYYEKENTTPHLGEYNVDF